MAEEVREGRRLTKDGREDNRALARLALAERQWESQLNAYMAWTLQNGHRPKIKGTDEEQKLYFWGTNQRHFHRTGKLAKARAETLVAWMPWFFDSGKQPRGIEEWLKDHSGEEFKATLGSVPNGYTPHTTEAVAEPAKASTEAKVSGEQDHKVSENGLEQKKVDWCGFSSYRDFVRGILRVSGSAAYIPRDPDSTPYIPCLALRQRRYVRNTVVEELWLTNSEKHKMAEAGFFTLDLLEMEMERYPWAADKMKLLRSIGLSDDAAWAIMHHYNLRVGLLDIKVSRPRPAV